jgi:hypothetical protein
VVCNCGVRGQQVTPVHCCFYVGMFDGQMIS